MFFVVFLAFSVYIDFGTDPTETVSFDFAFTGASTTRTWEIKTTQLECSNPSRFSFSLKFVPFKVEC
jgi:hypothetical protein